MNTAWISVHRLSPSARVRLFCFPYAGGSAAAFRTWPKGVGHEVDVVPLHYPGRGARLSEPLLRRAGDLARAAAEAMAPHRDLPFALFGHSLGALLAFETARALRRLGGRQPSHLVVSGRRGPRIPEPETPIHGLADALFVDEVQRRYDAIPQAVLAEPELMALLLPSLRADFEVLETYAYVQEPALECSISAAGGDADARATLDGLAAWRDETRGAFELRTFEGGHFFIAEGESPFLEWLRTGLLQEGKPLAAQAGS